MPEQPPPGARRPAASASGGRRAGALSPTPAVRGQRSRPPAPDGSAPLPTQAPAQPADDEPGFVLNVELLAWALVVLAAAAFRLLDLHALPLGPAESLRARGAYDLAGGRTAADYGGDLASGLTALTFALFGDSAVTARVVSALLGTAAVAALALYRPLLGRGAALAAALLLALSPVAIVTARTLGPEAAALPLALLLPPLVWTALFRQNLQLLPLLGAVIGFGVGSGALFLFALLVVAAWLAVEVAWRDAPEPAATLRLLRRGGMPVIAAAAALLFGVVLALVRYGAWPDGLTLAAVGAWNGPPPVAAASLSGHYLLDVLLGYEMLPLALGIAGAVLLLRRWRAGSSTPGERLTLLWAGLGLLFTVLALHREPGQLLALTVPLALLGGVVTVEAGSQLAGLRDGRAWGVLATLLPVAGYVLVNALAWARAQNAPRGDALAVFLLLVGAVLAVAWVTRLAPAAAGGVLALLAWAVLGPLTVHAASSAAFGGGSEILTGTRTVPEVRAVAGWVAETAQPGEPVWVERRLRPSLAWPLRDRVLLSYAGQPPAGVAAVELVPPGALNAAAPVRSAPVTERWTADTLSRFGILRWWVFRQPWGTVETLRAQVGRR